jgi:8-oxo-dGTP pyrophosphatase MutT (NUDIX family)
MHRGYVLSLLRRHAARVEDPHEAAMVAETIAFVEANADCLQRVCVPGHLTGSAWVIDPTRTRTLLTHHRKLGKWLQPGGHADGEENLLEVALREAREESGLTKLRVVSPDVFDVDRHWIPANGNVPGHYHFDVRFLLEADPAEPLTVSDESHDLAWVELPKVTELNPEASMVRMVWKTIAGG